MSNEFKLVPVEPDEEMQDVGCSAMPVDWASPFDAGKVYEAMLAAAPQPPALGGEPESKLIKLAAELASRRPIRSLQDLCDRQKSVSTAKLIEDVEMCGDFLAAIAIDIRHCVEASRAHLAPLQAEIESRTKAQNILVGRLKEVEQECDQLKARCDDAIQKLEFGISMIDDDERGRNFAKALRTVIIALSKPAGSEQV